MPSILKSLVLTVAFTSVSILTSLVPSTASAGPLVSTGGIAILLASCEGPNFEVAVASYDGVVKANVHTVSNSIFTNLLSAVVQSKTPQSVHGLEFATASGAHPAFDLVIQTPAGSDGFFTAFLSAELNNSGVIISQPVKCSWAAAPMVNK